MNDIFLYIASIFLVVFAYALGWLKGYNEAYENAISALDTFIEDRKNQGSRDQGRDDSAAHK